MEKMQKRITVADTDEGKELAGRIEDLKELLKAYRSGLLKERVRLRQLKGTGNWKLVSFGWVKREKRDGLRNKETR